MPVTLDEALRKFDLVDANLARLEKVWTKIEAAIPNGISFCGAGPEGRAYDDLCRSFIEIRDALPAIDGWRIEAAPQGLDEIAQSRLDAREIEFECPEASVTTERGIFQAGDEIHEYRFRFNKKRRDLVRSKLRELLALVDEMLASLQAACPERTDKVDMDGPEWASLAATIEQIERLIGAAPRKGRWSDLYRHLRFAKACDLYDIKEQDWPSVKRDIEASFFTEQEPIPVDVGDLGELVAQRPAGPVTTALTWTNLADDDFERLVLNIIQDAPGYENPQWLTRTRAPDRGRDLSATRVAQDSLSGVSRRRVIIQCRHWLSKSISIDEVASVGAQMKLWEPPAVDVLILVTSGRFTTDAVDWIEKHNHGRERPEIEMWPENRLEQFLAQRPHLTAEFRLR